MVTDFDVTGTYSVKDKAPHGDAGRLAREPALYTDLNEPVLVEDPEGKISRDGRSFRASYPIVHPPIPEGPSVQPIRASASSILRATAVRRSRR